MKTLNWSLVDKTLNILFSFGAAVVIFGALAKIQHWENADVAITAGLLTEVGIFGIMGITEWLKPQSFTQEVIQHSEVTTNISLPTVDPDLQEEIVVFHHNLKKINTMMDNIINSAK